ncbi:ABC transporter ATP-binding protein [Enterococcus faecium]|uniref:ABC transporter ATP-binding protein n=1 Tax=Enterococcus faecium TaxID=1352 RepID=UPI00339010D7
MQLDKREKVDKNAAKRLLKYVSGTYKLRFILVLLFILLSAAAGVIGSMFLKVLIDDHITPLIKSGSQDFSGLQRAILFMAFIYLVGVLTTYIYNRLMVIIGQGVQKRIRDEMFTKMQVLPVGYFDTHSYGDIMSRYTNDIDTLRQMITQSIPMAISSVASIVMVVAGMFYTSPLLTVAVLILVFVMVKVSNLIAKKSSTYFSDQQKDIGEINGYIEEMISGQKVVKVFCYEEEAKDKFNAHNEQLFNSADSANKFANMMGPVTNNLSNFIYVVVAILGGALALGGVTGLTLGALISFLQLTRSFSQPVSQISQQVNSVIMALAGSERIFQLMDELPEEDGGYVTLVHAEFDENGTLHPVDHHTGVWAWRHPHQDGTVTFTQVKGDILLENVDFSYDGKKQILKNVNLYAKPGEKIAFVGATGAGKTTITNLINRFYDIDQGKIRYDGINISKIKKADLRRSLGIVLQDTHLFSGTVKENIRYGNLNATDEEVEAAAKLANAESFISRLPQGYDTVIHGDGSGLSQGQRQLLAIARAAIADPPVMILDEATSSIDTRTEKLVQDGMDRLMEGRTVLVIAHRLSTIQDADAIMVLDQGQIIERGNHEALIDQRGAYYQLSSGMFDNVDEMQEQLQEEWGKESTLA